MESRAAIKQKYKANPPDAGIFRITNKANGKVFIGRAMNVQGKLNGQMMQLKWGTHRNRALQVDWNCYGADNFSFEILDCLEVLERSTQDLQAELTALEELWMAKLEPFDEKGYNQRPRE